MPRPIIYGDWTVMYSFAAAREVVFCGFGTSAFTTNDNAGDRFIPQDNLPPPTPQVAGHWPQWRDDTGPGPHAPNVWHTVQWAHRPTTDEWLIDGVPLQSISPDLQAAYDANEAAFPGTHMSFYVLAGQFLAFDNTAIVTFGPINLGTTPGGNDILAYDPLVDGLAPWTTIQGNVSISADGLQCGPADGFGGLLDNPNGVDFLVDAPWPPTYRFHCSFSVGVTRNLRSFSNLPPPDDIELVQAALPETLLSQGYRIEFGTYSPDGTPRPLDAVSDATVALLGLQEPEDEQ